MHETRQFRAAAIVLFDRAYWQRMINFDALAAADMTAHSDLDLFECADTAEEAWHSLQRRGLLLQRESAAEPVS